MHKKTPRYNIYGVRLNEELVRELRHIYTSDAYWPNFVAYLGRNYSNRVSLAEVHDMYVRCHTLAVHGLARHTLSDGGHSSYIITDKGKKWLAKFNQMTLRKLN